MSWSANGAFEATESAQLHWLVLEFKIIFLTELQAQVLLIIERKLQLVQFPLLSQVAEARDRAIKEGNA